MLQFIIENSNLVRSDSKPSNHTPPLENEASKSILCVFVEKRSHQQGKAPIISSPPTIINIDHEKIHLKSLGKSYHPLDVPYVINPTIW